MAPADLIVLCLLAVAALRGLMLGLMREATSLASLAAACVAVRFLAEPGGVWLRQRSEDTLDPLVAQVAAGIGVAIAVLVLGAILGRVLRGGARAVGLGWLDRGAGGALGAAEGALVAGILLALVAAFTGRDHPFVAESEAFEILENLEAGARGDPLPDVAAPPG